VYAQNEKKKNAVLGGTCSSTYIFLQPENQTVDDGDTAYFITNTLIFYESNYWQVSSDDGNTWAEMNNENRDTLKIANVSFSLNNYKYRRQLRHCTVWYEVNYYYSDTVTLTVKWYWTGAYNTDWRNELNWSGNVVPESSSAIFIPSGLKNYPYVDNIVYCKSLTVSPGAKVNVADGGNIIITGK
jgi:hypothetical protein